MTCKTTNENAVGEISPIDANVQSVRRKMLIRADLGLNKYGVTTERTDIGTLKWLQHAQDEAMDLAVYLERLIIDEKRKLNARARAHS